MSEPRCVLHRCSCGASYDADEWQALSCPGLMDCGTGCTLVLKDCPRCGSTMAMVMQPMPIDVFEDLRKDDAA